MQSKHIRNRKLALEKTNEKDSTREHKHVRAYAQMGPRKEAALRQASELVHASEKRNKKKKKPGILSPAFRGTSSAEEATADGRGAGGPLAEHCRRCLRTDLDAARAAGGGTRGGGEGACATPCSPGLTRQISVPHPATAASSVTVECGTYTRRTCRTGRPNGGHYKCGWKKRFPRTDWRTRWRGRLVKELRGSSAVLGILRGAMALNRWVRGQLAPCARIDRKSVV